jgi:hypothetical protein
MVVNKYIARPLCDGRVADRWAVICTRGSPGLTFSDCNMYTGSCLILRVGRDIAVPAVVQRVRHRTHHREQTESELFLLSTIECGYVHSGEVDGDPSVQDTHENLRCRQVNVHHTVRSHGSLGSWTLHCTWICRTKITSSSSSCSPEAAFAVSQLTASRDVPILLWLAKASIAFQMLSTLRL